MQNWIDAPFLIDRPEYLKTLQSWRDKADVIKILTGVRRCGKSTIFKLFQKKLLAGDVSEAQIHNISFEDADNLERLGKWKTLHDHIKAGLVPDKMNYIFLDEIQEVDQFQKAVNSLRLLPNTDLYLTGSNSKILSGEYATLLSGRYITINVMPLSFKEYATAYPFKNAHIPQIFNDYVYNGGLPYTMRFIGATNPLLGRSDGWDIQQIRMFVKGIYDTIVLKDVVERKGVKDVLRLQDLIKFMFDNIGNETSVRNIKNALEAEGIKIDAATIDNYLDGLLDAFALYRVGRYDIKGKQLLKTNAKYYLVDVGFRYAVLGSEGDVGRILENIVYLELLRRGYEVNIGKIKDYEVDFVARKNGFTEYYQVAQTISEKATLERELRALDAISDHNQKFLITMDTFFQESHKGIKVLNAMDWLLSSE